MNVPDEVWAWGLRIGVPLVSAAILWVFGKWAKVNYDNTTLGKLLTQLRVMLQGFSSDITSGIQPDVAAAVADGVVTADERKMLIDKLVSLVKASAEQRFFTQLQVLLGLSTGNALDTWLRGIAGDHVDAQLQQALPLAQQSTLVGSKALTPAATPVVQAAARP